jgi:hypothetical protein
METPVGALAGVHWPPWNPGPAVMRLLMSLPMAYVALLFRGQRTFAAIVAVQDAFPPPARPCLGPKVLAWEPRGTSLPTAFGWARVWAVGQDAQR